MDGSRHLFFLTNTIFLGFLVSTLYGGLGAILVGYFGAASDVTRFAEAYFKTFNSAVSGGFVFATALLVYRTQNYIPAIIENAFTQRELAQTHYFEQRKELFNWWKTAILSIVFALVAIFIFYWAKFPLDELSNDLLIGVGSLQYAAGVYIGRKIFHTAHLLRSIESIAVRKEIFKADRLFGISMYVNSVSTATAIAVYIGVRSYYRAPFEYDSVLGEAMATAMFIPAIIAIPVLLFAYYSRTSVRRMYERSIEDALQKLRSKGKADNRSDFEIQTGIVELEKNLRDELKYRLRATLEDLPMAVVVGIALLSAFKS
ncbi:MAG TPA: hypothetical protein VF652_10690 [Allosphingosinicella sp.]|jgi:hypothetical protein